MVPVILLYFFLALDSMLGDGPTMDEQNHIARGLAFLRTGDPRLSLEHPPLVNVVSALPLLTLPHIRLPTDHPSWDRPEGWYEFADLLLWEYNDDVTRMVFLARLPILFMHVGLALVGFHFARKLWGSRSAFVAFLLLLFEPNHLAHGRYSTTDLGGAAFLLLATFLLWRFWSSPTRPWVNWVLAGVGLGLAFGSKLSTLAFVPIFAIMALIPVEIQQPGATYWRATLSRLLKLAAAGLLALLVLWAIFGFEFKPFFFQSPYLTFLNEVNGPMPTFWAGVEQIAGFAGRGRGSAFLLGDFSDTGFLAYFPVAFLTKTPVAVLLLLPVAVVLLLRDAHSRIKALFLLVPTLLYFLLSMFSALNIGYRHLLLITPFIMLLISGLVRHQSKPFDGLPATSRDGQRRIYPYLYYGLILTVLVSDLLIHPHYLSFFNWPAGGPQHGYNILVDSNIDWGQDLLRLKRWLDEQGVSSVNLAWFGSADPGYYDIPYRPLPGLGRDEFFRLWWDVPFNRLNPEPGIYAISVTNLWELPLRQEEKGVFAWFRDREPDARIGYSILVYEVQ